MNGNRAFISNEKVVLPFLWKIVTWLFYFSSLIAGFFIRFMYIVYFQKTRFRSVPHMQKKLYYFCSYVDSVLFRSSIMAFKSSPGQNTPQLLWPLHLLLLPPPPLLSSLKPLPFSCGISFTNYFLHFYYLCISSAFYGITWHNNYNIRVVLILSVWEILKIVHSLSNSKKL